MFSILPFILIILSIAIIIIVIVRRFPQLAILDVNSIPEVRMEQKKNEILKKRLEKETVAADRRRMEVFQPIVQRLKNIQLSFRQYVGGVHKRMLERSSAKKTAQVANPVDVGSLRTLIQAGENALLQKNFEEAEVKFIEAIKLDSKNADAYRNLGQVYLEKGGLDEAREAFEFLIKINPNDDVAMIKLAEVMRAKGDREKAVEYYEQSIVLDDGKASRFFALAEVLSEMGRNDLVLESISQAAELEPQNPKYLDMLIEFSVKCGNKDLASEAYQQLRMVNPENNKLAVLKDKIENMPS